MNERIKQLVEQTDGVVINKLMTGAKQYTFLENDLVEFAELIINECVNQCFTDDYKKILKHFDMPEDEDEELEDGQCPCGEDGGTSCGSPNCYQLTGYEP